MTHWYLWMLAGAGAQATLTVAGAYALRKRIQRRVAVKLTERMQAELAKAMPGVSGVDPSAMLGQLLAHAPVDALAHSELPPRLTDELAAAVVSDPTQAQMRQHQHALRHQSPFDQARDNA
jgi:hypothetical protein